MNSKNISFFISLLIVASLFTVQPATTQAFEQFPRSLAWERISQSGTYVPSSDGYGYSTITAAPGQIVPMSLTVKNRSRNPEAEVWYGKSSLFNEGPTYPNAHAIGVGTSDPMDHVPSWIDPSSFAINGNRLAYYDGPPVYKGQNVTLNWNIKLQSDLTPGYYVLNLALVREFDEWGQRVTSTGANAKYQTVRYVFNIGNTNNVTYSNNTYDYSLTFPGTYEIWPTHADSDFTARGGGNTLVGGDLNIQSHPNLCGALAGCWEDPRKHPNDYVGIHLNVVKTNSNYSLEQAIQSIDANAYIDYVSNVRSSVVYYGATGLVGLRREYEPIYYDQLSAEDKDGLPYDEGLHDAFESFTQGNAPTYFFKKEDKLYILDTRGWNPSWIEGVVSTFRLF